MTYLSTLVYKLHINAKLSVETKPGRTEKPPQNSTKYLWGGSQSHPEKRKKNIVVHIYIYIYIMLYYIISYHIISYYIILYYIYVIIYLIVYVYVS